MPNYFNPYQYPQNYSPNYGYQMPQQNQQIQDGGFMPAPNEEFARTYPVAIGKSVTFKDENAPYIYTKTMGFSQMDAPKFERYRLVKEDTVERPNSAQNETNDIKSIIDSIDKINDDIEAIWTEIDNIKNAKPKKPVKRDKDGDDGYDE